MKRIVAAIIILIFSALVCGTEFMYVSSCADNITKKMEDIEDAYRSGDADSALSHAYDAQAQWEDCVSKMDMLLYHDYVDGISANIASLKIYIHEEDPVGLYSTCSDIILKAQSLKKSELPILQNII